MAGAPGCSHRFVFIIQDANNIFHCSIIIKLLSQEVPPCSEGSGTRGSNYCEDLRWPRLSVEVRGQLKGATRSHFFLPSPGGSSGFDKEGSRGRGGERKWEINWMIQ